MRRPRPWDRCDGRPRIPRAGIPERDSDLRRGDAPPGGRKGRSIATHALDPRGYRGSPARRGFAHRTRPLRRSHVRRPRSLHARACVPDGTLGKPEGPSGSSNAPSPSVHRESSVPSAVAPRRRREARRRPAEFPRALRGKLRKRRPIPRNEGHGVSREGRWGHPGGLRDDGLKRAVRPRAPFDSRRSRAWSPPSVPS